MATTISISGLVKRFGPTRALDGLDLEVRTGEVHGFLGPNGAGKTTTLRVLLGCCGPTPAPPPCSAATPGATPPSCTGAWPMCPGTSPCGPACPAAR